MNIKVFNQELRINETRHVPWQETFTFECELDLSICNNKQLWNNDKYRCECKELIDKSRCGDEFIWNPSTCECEWHKSCGTWEILDYKNCKCRKRLIEKTSWKIKEDIDGDNIIYYAILNNYWKICKSWIIYIVILIIMFVIIIGISSACLCFHWCKKKNISVHYINLTTTYVKMLYYNKINVS